MVWHGRSIVQRGFHKFQEPILHAVVRTYRSELNIIPDAAKHWYN